MLKIIISEKMRERHWEYVKAYIQPHFADKKWQKYLQKESENKEDMLDDDALAAFAEMIKFCKKYLKEITVGDIDELRRLYRCLHKYETICDINETAKGIFRDTLLDIFDYQKFSRSYTQFLNVTVQGVSQKEKNWTPYAFVFLSGITVCPYCNRQYITPVVTPKKKVRADLDHFLPKSKYPYFSMSIYNLVPCCKFCNSSLKNDKDFGIDAPNPYKDDYDKLFSFGTNLERMDEPEICITQMKKEMEPILEELVIKERYLYHKQIAKDLLIKRQMYTEELIEKMKNQYASNYSTEEFKAFMIGYPEKESMIDQEPLGKLKRDLAKEFGFIRE